ncbi:acyl-CoA thioesterase [Nonomuraea solani]|nr:thioesterase family protein [Nonomuraea solani]
MVSLPRRVEHVDTDAAGVMHFTRYASLIETALLENLEALGVGTRLMDEHKVQPAVSELRMRYSAAARFSDELLVRVGVEHVGGASYRISGFVYRREDGAETLLASGLLVMCLVRVADGAPAALPATLRTTLARCMGEADG